MREWGHIIVRVQEVRLKGPLILETDTGVPERDDPAATADDVVEEPGEQSTDAIGAADLGPGEDESVGVSESSESELSEAD